MTSPLPPDHRRPGDRFAPKGEGRETWSRRQFCSKRRSDDSVFPIRHLPTPSLTCGHSKIAHKRLKHRVEVWKDVNQSIDALNSLYGCSRYPGAEELQGGLSDVHLSIHSRLTSLAARRPKTVLQPKLAARQLLGSRLGYTGDGTSVEPYDASRVSLPEGQSAPVPWCDALPANMREYMKLENILLDDDIPGYGQRLDSNVLYTDIHIARDKQVRMSFLARLNRCGILAASKTSCGTISPFFVKKKGGRQRLVLDCRNVNECFRRPPKPEMAAAEAIQRFDNPEGSPIYIAEADIQNCFYQIGLPSDLARYFCFEHTYSREDLQQLGLSRDLDGYQLDSDPYYLCLTALPMGFSFSFWIVQELHYDALKQCGFPASRCVLGNWPTPSLKEGPVALAYCDNLNIFGKDPKEVDNALSIVMKFLESKGFALHEVVYATPWSKPLGSFFNGYDNLLGSRPDKAWTLQGALKWFGQGPRVSGKQVEIILGHFTHEALYARGALSVFRAAYTFVRDSYHTRQILWPSVRREMLVAAGLMPLLVAHLDLPWSPIVHTTDACMSGWGSCKGWVGSDLAKAHGQWSERWRFRRLTPEEWCPRRRALQDHSLHDLYTDPRTLGDQSAIYPHYFGIEDAELPEGVEPIPSHLDWRMHEGFPEVGDVSSWGWRVTGSGKFHFAESIGVKEARAVVYDLESQLRDPKQHRFKHLRLIDNFGDSLCLARGRASDYALLQLCRRYGALLLATGAVVSLRWVPSENNPADAPSRRYEHEAHSQLALYAKTKADGAGPPSREAVQRLRHNEQAWNQAARRLCSTITEPFQAFSPIPVKESPLPCTPQGKHRKKGFVQSEKETVSRPGPAFGRASGPLRHVDTRGRGFGDSHGSRAVSKVVRRVQCLADKRKSASRRDKPRSGSSGLPRCENIGRVPGFGGRKDCCSSKSLLCFSRSKTTPGPEDPQRFSPDKRGEFPPAPSRLCGGGDSSCMHVSSVTQSSHGDFRRHASASSAGRNHLDTQGRSPPPSTIQSGGFECVDRHHCGPRSRAVEQDRDHGRHHSSSVSKVARPNDGSLGPSTCSFRSSPVRTHERRVRSRLGPGDSLARNSSTSLPVETCRSSLGPGGQTAHRNQSYVPGEVAYIDVSSTLCQSQFDQKEFGSFEPRTQSILRVVPHPYGTDPPRSSAGQAPSSASRPSCKSGDVSALNLIDTKSGTSASRSHGFLHGSSVPQRVKVIEWCAGTSRIAGACSAVGVHSESFEISRNPLEDVLSRHVKSRLRQLIRHRHLRLLWIGIPCGSFSRARRGRKGGGGWPPPLRGDSPPDIFGLPDLSEKDQQRVLIGNRLANEMCVLIKLCIRCKVPVVIENPSSSRLFLFPALRKLMGSCSGNIVFHQCQYGTCFKKPTRLVAWNCDISPLCKVCTGSAKSCSLSMLPHTPLVGTKGKEGFWTAIASAYPEAFCRRVASLLSDGKSGIPQ